MVKTSGVGFVVKVKTCILSCHLDIMTSVSASINAPSSERLANPLVYCTGLETTLHYLDME